jgi:hypothetical protein
VVKLTPRDLKVEGSNPVPAAVTGREKSKQARACMTLRGYEESLIRLIMYAIDIYIFIK